MAAHHQSDERDTAAHNRDNFFYNIRFRYILHGRLYRHGQ